MRIVFFVHSLISDWNHGNAHFLRGVCDELVSQGHEVISLEPEDAWSLRHLVAAQGEEPVRAFFRRFPRLTVRRYDPERLDLRRTLQGSDLVIVHEWNDPALVAAIGEHRLAGADYRLLFHDTHHRSVTQPEAMARYDLSGYDGVLAFGDVVRDIYLDRGWAREAWTWHEAADTSIFRPTTAPEKAGDVVWIGNWGDDERTEEIQMFLLEPVRRLGLRARVHGVRYPEAALLALEAAGAEYAGWIPNYETPEVFARFKATVHIPRRPYAESLSGIPTIRPFEAMACGIPLLSAPWNDAEGLFTAGRDYLLVRDGHEMAEQLEAVLTDERLARSLATHARQTIERRHTCAHRVSELLEICERFGLPSTHSAAA